MRRERGLDRHWQRIVNSPDLPGTKLAHGAGVSLGNQARVEHEALDKGPECPPERPILKRRHYCAADNDVSCQFVTGLENQLSSTVMIASLLLKSNPKPAPYLLQLSSSSGVALALRRINPS